MNLFVDTSIWYAAANRSDPANVAAKTLLSSKHHWMTSDRVLVETWNFLHNKLGRHAAEAFELSIRSGLARIEVATQEDLSIAWRFGEMFPDQNFSFCDRTSFAIMLRLEISNVATLDHHFQIFRFGHGRRRGFNIFPQ